MSIARICMIVLAGLAAWAGSHGYAQETDGRLAVELRTPHRHAVSMQPLRLIARVSVPGPGPLQGAILLGVEAGHIGVRVVGAGIGRRISTRELVLSAWIVGDYVPEATAPTHAPGRKASVDLSRSTTGASWCTCSPRPGARCRWA